MELIWRKNATRQRLLERQDNYYTMFFWEGITSENDMQFSKQLVRLEFNEKIIYFTTK